MTTVAPSMRQTKKSPASKSEASKPSLPPPRPLTPRPRLFVTLLVVFAVWVGVLVTMYFKTVRSHHSPPPPATTGALAGS
jgi:hypothetical protein